MLSCTNSGKFERSETIDIFGDTVGRLPINSNRKLDISTITKWLIDNYFFGRKLHVDLVKTVKEVSIFKISVKGELATSVHRDYTFITMGNKNSFLLPIEFIQFSDIDDKMMLGGIYNYREFDYYFIYDIIGEKLTRTFDSRKIKDRQSFGFNQFRYGVHARLGFPGFNLWGYYGLNEVFQKNKGPFNTQATQLNFGVSIALF